MANPFANLVACMELVGRIAHSILRMIVVVREHTKVDEPKSHAEQHEISNIPKYINLANTKSSKCLSSSRSPHCSSFMGCFLFANHGRTCVTSRHSICLDPHELLSHYNAASQVPEFEDESVQSHNLRKICHNSLFSDQHHVGSKVAQRESLDLKHSRTQEYTPVLANCVYLDERNRRKENERVTSLLPEDEWITLGYVDLDTSDESSFPVAQKTSVGNPLVTTMNIFSTATALWILQR